MNTSAPPPRVLAGITTRNRANILPKALASLQNQTYPNLSVTVLDDASTDTTSALRESHPGVRWLRHDAPRGIIECRNELMRAAGTDYFLCLDDDAWFLQGDELALAITHLEADSTVAAVAFDILSPDRPAPAGRGAPRQTPLFIGCGHVLRVSAVTAAGFYADTPGSYGSEEKDLSLRLADLGYRIDLLPGVHVWHDKAWTGRDWFPLHRSGVVNELAMTLRRCPLPDLLLVLPLKFASFLLYWLKHPAFLRAGFAGVGDFLRHLGPVWRSRQPVRRDTFWRFRRTS